MNDEDHDGHTISLGPPAGSPADERACDDCEREGRNCTAHGGRPRVIAAEARKQMEQAEGAIGTDLDPEVPERGWEIHEPDDALRIVAAPASPVSPPVPDEIGQLRRWKAEATEVLGQWRKVHGALGSPAALGESIAAASLAEVERLTATPPVGEGRRLDVTELPEWVALVDAVNDDGGSVAGYRANVTGRASALTRAVRAAAAADREDRA